MERSIPFVPQFTVWYFSLYPLMWCCFYFYTTKSELIWLFKKFSLELLLAGAVFLTVPTIVPYYGWDGEGITAWLYRLADTMNLEANSFPSLHVAFAVTSAELCAARAGPVARGAFVLWAALVAISTLLTKQHVLIDLLGGLFLAWIVSRIRRE